MKLSVKALGSIPSTEKKKEKKKKSLFVNVIAWIRKNVEIS